MNKYVLDSINYAMEQLKKQDYVLKEGFCVADNKWESIDTQTYLTKLCRDTGKLKIGFGIPISKRCNWFAKIKANCTLWLDKYADCLDYDKPYADAEVVIRRNTILFIYKEDDIMNNCKFVGRLASGVLKIGWQTLKDAIEDNCFDILEFTEKCKELYLSEVVSNDR